MEELVFQYLPLHVDVDQAFGPLTRSGTTVVILLRDKNGAWILGQKTSFYPEGIVRMLGGGMDTEEDVAAAAQREIQEETGLTIDSDKLVPLVHADITTTDPTLTGSVFVFYAQVFDQPQAADDISGLVFYSDRDINELVSRYSNLPNQPIKAEESATWSDYGQIWGPIHAAALARVKDLSL